MKWIKKLDTFYYWRAIEPDKLHRLELIHCPRKNLSIEGNLLPGPGFEPKS